MFSSSLANQRDPKKRSLDEDWTADWKPGVTHGEEKNQENHYQHNPTKETSFKKKSFR